MLLALSWCCRGGWLLLARCWEGVLLVLHNKGVVGQWADEWLSRTNGMVPGFHAGRGVRG